MPGAKRFGRHPARRFFFALKNHSHATGLIFGDQRRITIRHLAQWITAHIVKIQAIALAALLFVIGDAIAVLVNVSVAAIFVGAAEDVFVGMGSACQHQGCRQKDIA